MTHNTHVKGRFTSHHSLPYVLTPNYQSHNSYGYRGPEFRRAKGADTKRVICIGASTTYGDYVEAHETHCAKLEVLLSQAGIEVEMINAGVPGWVSIDSLLNFQLRIIPLKPDIVIVYQGRNEVFPQSFNHFEPDYSHFRRNDYNTNRTNIYFKPLFRLSHFFMALSVYEGDRFGWESREEHPLYGAIRYENQPSDAELIGNLHEASRASAYRNAVVSLVSICQARDIKVVLGTMAFRAEQLNTGFLDVPTRQELHDHPNTDPAVYTALQNRVESNNEVIRDVALRYSVPVAETASLVSRPEFFVDDCHFNREGHARRAAMFVETILESGVLEVDH